MAGVRAYEESKYQQAVEHLERAVTLNPESIDAHLELARSYNQMYIPAVEPGPSPWAEPAVREYEKVLELNPSHTDALKSLGYLLFVLGRYSEAESYYRRALAVDAGDPEAMYGVAVIDFQRGYTTLAEKRMALKLSRKKRLIGYAACVEVRDQILTRVEEEIGLLNRTLQILQDGDAMSYMGDSYQERADIECGDRSSYNADLLAAKQWWRRSCQLASTGQSRSLAKRWVQGPPPPPAKHGNPCVF